MKEMKYSQEDLKIQLALPYEMKVKKAQLRIKEAVQQYGEDGLCLNFSGGKDSQVLLDIVQKMGYNIPVVYCNTGLEDRGSRLIGEEMATIVVRPELTFAQVIQKYGYPIISKEVANRIEITRKTMKKYGSDYSVDKLCRSVRESLYGFEDRENSMFDFTKYRFLLDAPFKISNKCCEINKEKPLDNYQKREKRIPLIALLANESYRRKLAWRKLGCNAFDTAKPSSRPLMIWTEQDILRYLKENNIKIAPEYGVIIEKSKKGEKYLDLSGSKRTGCMYCLFGISRQRDRLLLVKQREPKLFNYIMNGGEFNSENYWVPNSNGLGFKFVIDWLNQNGEVFKKKPILY